MRLAAWRQIIVYYILKIVQAAAMRWGIGDVNNASRRVPPGEAKSPGQAAQHILRLVVSAKRSERAQKVVDLVYIGREFDTLDIWHIVVILVPNHGNPHVSLVERGALDVCHDTPDLILGHSNEGTHGACCIYEEHEVGRVGLLEEPCCRATWRGCLRMELLELQFLKPPLDFEKAGSVLTIPLLPSLC